MMVLFQSSARLFASGGLRAASTSTASRGLAAALKPFTKPVFFNPKTTATLFAPSRSLISAGKGRFSTPATLTPRAQMHMKAPGPNALGSAGRAQRRLLSVEEAITKSQKTIGWWLVGTSAMIFGAVILGAVTRLTESGLSMVKWHPVKGIRPPITDEEWEAEFECYKQYPEYKYSNGMTVEDFKNIFYMEWGHRIWGRMIGVVFILPAAYFFLTKRIPQGQKKMILSIGGLLGFQGVLGWLMVKSGLDNDPQGLHAPRVSQYRLAAHLGSAFVLYVLTLWTAFGNLMTSKPTISAEAVSKVKAFKFMVHLSAGLIFLTAISGAFVAGLDAGLVYNEFPLMGESIFPSDYWANSPKWKNLFENPSAAQFNHRLLGVSTFAAVSALWLKSRALPLHPRAKAAVTALLAVATAQVSLGIATLLYFVPTPVATTHQGGALTLLSVALWVIHELKHYKIFRK